MSPTEVLTADRDLSWRRQGRDFVLPPDPVDPPPVDPPPGPDPRFKLGYGYPTFEDNFDYVDPSTGLHMIDPAKWNIRERATFGLLNDTTIITKESISADSSNIAHIKGTWRDTFVSTTTGPSGNPTIRTHDTGYMDHRASGGTSQIYAQQYGVWEIRCQMPTGPNTLGALAAFWLRNGNTGELDIVESWGYGVNGAFAQQNEGTSTMTSHSNTSGTNNLKKAWTIEQILGINVTTNPVHAAYHVWTLEWTPSYFRGYRDGQQFCNETPATDTRLWNPTYWGSPNHMRLNLHIGPSTQYWGIPDVNNRALTQDPLDFKVDYIRAWKYGA